MSLPWCSFLLISLFLSFSLRPSLCVSLCPSLSLSRGHHLSFSLPLCLLSSRLISPLCHPSFRAVNAYPEGPGGSGGPLNSVPADTNADVRSHTRAQTHTWAYTHKRTQEDTHINKLASYTHRLWRCVENHRGRGGTAKRKCQCLSRLSPSYYELKKKTLAVSSVLVEIGNVLLYGWHLDHARSIINPNLGKPPAYLCVYACHYLLCLFIFELTEV